MCGIAGWIDWQESMPANAMENMVSRMRHRGPDGEGYFFWDGPQCNTNARGEDTYSELAELPHVKECLRPTRLAFGHRRLSIIDQSFRGHQPMTSADGNTTVIFNGEIYNFIELRSQLEACGHKFRSNSDTEVILASYSQWGLDAFSHFNGMWGMAIFDASQGHLILSRDRFGKKPLYIARDRGFFAFASEIKAILALDRFRPVVNKEQALAYLATGVTKSDPTRRETLIAGIEEVMPSTTVVINVQDPDITANVSSYWQLPMGGGQGPGDKKDVSLWAEEFRELLDDSVKIRLRSDVPVALTLSGGLDSSSVAAAVTTQDADHKLEAYISAGGPGDNDLPYALDVVNHLKMPYTTVEVPASGNELWETLDEYIWAADEPPSDLGGGAAGGRRLFREMASRGVRVALEGTGGDEMLSGYPGYFGPTFLMHLFKQREFGRFIHEFRALGDGTAGLSARWLVSTMLKAWGRNIPFADQIPKGRGTGPRTWQVQRDIALDWPAWSSVYNRISDRGNSTDMYSRQRYFIFQHFFPSYLHYEDRNSMEFSVESRLPLLDYRLAELCFRMPVSTRFQDGFNKYVMRLAYTDALPKNVIDRKKKQGFYSPADQWLKNNLDQVEQELVDSDLLDSLIQKEKIPELLQWFSKAPEGVEGVVETKLIWRIYALAIWARVFSVVSA